MAVYYTPLPWSVCLTEHERSLLSCFGQMSLLQMACSDLCNSVVQNLGEIRPRAIAILWAIINAGHDGLRLVVRLRRELATMDQTHLGGTLLGWADSAGLNLHMLFSGAIYAAWRELQDLYGLDLFPSDRPASLRSPSPRSPSPPPGTFWI